MDDELNISNKISEKSFVIYALYNGKIKQTHLPKLNNTNLSYQTFKEIDGNDIKLIDSRTRQTLKGKDLANNKITLDTKGTYAAFCTPLENSANNLAIQPVTHSLTVRELSQWCNYKIIWHDIVKHEYQNTIILEDDFTPTPYNFTQKLYSFISAIPSSYDLAYIDTKQIAGVKIPLPGNQSHISKFSEDASWGQSTALMFNFEFVKKLLSLPYFASSLELFFMILNKQGAKEFDNKPIETYVPTGRLSDISYKQDKIIANTAPIDVKPKESPVIISKPKATTKAKMLYDAAYIINLDRSTDRWEKITKHFDEFGLPYQRFKAVDGYKILLQNLQMNYKFTGQELKNNPALMNPSVMHQVTCNPDEYFPIGFNLMPVRALTAGELGIWCSYRIIWQDIVIKGYNNAMVFEDDVLIRSTNFPKDLNKLIIDLPETYDIAYTGVYHKQGYKIPLQGAEHISKFSENSLWDGAWSVLISNKGAQTLISDDYYFLAIDNYFQGMSHGIVQKTFKLETYRSSKTLVWYEENEISEIENMGRTTASNYKQAEEEEDANIAYGYDIVYVINLERSKDRWKKISSHLDKIGLPYTRFNAIDGYNVEIFDVQNNQTYLGIDMKNKNLNMTLNSTYVITCDPLAQKPTIFNITVAKPIDMAGEIGVLCSYKLVWRDIILNQYKNAVVLEDDFVSRTDNFVSKLHRFVSDLPASYDLAYIDTRQYSGSKIPLQGKSHISKFSDDSEWNGLWGTVFSYNGAQKLFSVNPYIAAVDVCISMLAKLKALDIYVSSIKLGGHEGASEICKMGLNNDNICLSYSDEAYL
ncbi:MAG: glycosyltransferase family 25 protein, partial [Pseudomonadota bacterium]